MEEIKNLTVQIPKSLHLKLKSLAVKKDTTIREIVARLIREEIERNREQ
jgi:hypothetical protein